VDLPISEATLQLEWGTVKQLTEALTASIEGGVPRGDDEAAEAWLREVVGTLGFLSKKLDVLAVTLISPPGG